MEEEKNQTSESETPDMPEQTPREEKPDPSGQWYYISAAVILALMLAIGTGWYGYQWIVGPEPTPDTTQNQAEQNNTSEEDTGTSRRTSLRLRNVVYAHGTEYDSSGAIYSRPIQGGERKQLASVDNMRNISRSRHQHLSTAYSFVRNDTELWVGHNGKSPEKVHEITGNNNRYISSPAISRDGSRVAYGVVSMGGDNPNKVPIYSLDLASGDTTKLYEGAKANNVFWWAPLEWTPDHETLLLTWGAVGTDAPPPGYALLSTASDHVAEIVEGGYSLGEFAASSTGGLIAYSRATVDEDRPTEGLIGHYIGSPHTLFIKNPVTGQKTRVTTSEDRFADVQWVENAPEARLAYAAGNTIHIHNPKQETDIKTFQYPGRDIRNIYAITPEYALIDVDNPREDVTSALMHVDLEAKKAEQLTLTTPVTNILGITGELTEE